ncbi:DUF58 domain-containing protein [Clostridium sp. MSJ-11]|uniref:DUF58 domain-containing protein n=1 Tax=Clostridium mobile TaxID=2841512 RepID=A0ABS6ENU8_9CLOT|nr:DUF58 domain-containing protein [Clostridium mobile]MBU5486054.1 DUF58 domain-containing protein [Clostridium mobile]
MIKINKRIILFILITFIYAYFEGGYFPYALFYSFLIPFILSFIVIVILHRNVGVDIKLDKDVVSTREEIKITTVIKNYNILPLPYIEVKNKALYSLDREYNGEALNIKLDENKRLSRNIKFLNRGIYDFGNVTLTFKDYLYMLTLSKTFEKDLKVKVYPKIHQMEDFNFHGQEFINEFMNKKGIINEDYTISDIRKYRTGDSLRKIHWKLSAKYGELFVKKFDALQGEEYNIFLNMNKEDFYDQHGEENEEELVEICVSIINNILNNNMKSCIHINNEENSNMNINNIEDFNALMEYFLVNKSEGQGSFAQYIIDNLYKMAGKNTIIICTPKIDTNVKEALLLASKLGYRIVVFYSSKSLEIFKNDYYLKERGIEVISSILRKESYE